MSLKLEVTFLTLTISITTSGHVNCLSFSDCTCLFYSGLVRIKWGIKPSSPTVNYESAALQGDVRHFFLSLKLQRIVVTIFCYKYPRLYFILLGVWDTPQFASRAGYSDFMRSALRSKFTRNRTFRSLDKALGVLGFKNYVPIPMAVREKGPLTCIHFSMITCLLCIRMVSFKRFFSVWREACKNALDFRQFPGV